MRSRTITRLAAYLARVITVLPGLTRKNPGGTRVAGTKNLRPRALISLGALLPLGGIVLYTLTGASGAGPADENQADRVDSIMVVEATPVPDTATLPSVEAMLEQLEQRLLQQPDDSKGWNLLGRSYQHLGRTEAAKNAFARASNLDHQHQPRPVNKSAGLQGTVSLDPSLYHGVSATDTVFILARAVYGPRMPLAVQQKHAIDLPISYRLDDSMAISSRLKLSDYQDVIISVRISPNGDAATSAGSLAGYSGIVHPGQDATVNIVVDQEPILASMQQRSKTTGGKI